MKILFDLRKLQSFTTCSLECALKIAKKQQTRPRKVYWMIFVPICTPSFDCAYIYVLSIQTLAAITQ